MNTQTPGGRMGGTTQADKPSDPFRAAASDAPPATPGDAVGQAAARFAEAREYASYLVTAKLDALRVMLRNIGVYAALGIVGLVAAAGLIVTAVVLLLVGAANGLGAAFGGMYWLGDLIVGLVVLAGLAAAVIFGMKILTKTTKKKLVEKYEHRQRQQRVQFGHDVRQRAEQQQ